LPQLNKASVKGSSEMDDVKKLVWKPHGTGLRADTGRKGSFIIKPISDCRYVVTLRRRPISHHADIESAKALAEDQFAIMVMNGTDAAGFWRDQDEAEALLREMAMADTGLFDDPEEAYEIWTNMTNRGEIIGHKG
jgi:hypothetical protein